MHHPPPKAASIAGLRLGRVESLFEDSDPEVRAYIDGALDALAAQGAEIIEVSLPEVGLANDIFTTISRPELIAALSRERFNSIREEMNVDVADRAAPGLSISADAYIQAIWRHRELREAGRIAMREVDAWIAPSKLRLAPVFPGTFVSLEKDKELISLCAGPTRVASTFGFCAASQPVQRNGGALPVGMQVMCGEFDEMRLLSIILAIEQTIGRPPKPDVMPFIHAKVK